MKKEQLFTSEAVSEGHPDKVCDQIADRILDVALKADPFSHVACEVFTSQEYVLVGGEITSKAKLNYEKIVRDTLKDIGYLKPSLGIGYKSCQVDVRVREQSPEINHAVSNKDILKLGAGDQGIVFGYATNETKNYMPLPISLASAIMKRASKLRKDGKFKGARPDMKAQVTFDYKTRKINNVLVSIQHDPDINKNKFKDYVIHNVIIPVIKEYKLNTNFKTLINPSGSFVIGGPLGDTGLTGRKLVCDTYGGSAHQGGGALSGKDPTKIDRSATYYARYMAKNLVAAGVAKRLEVQISYAIGVSEPLSISFLTFKTSKYDDELIEKIIKKVFDARVGAIIKAFSLNKPKFRYVDTSTYGHFGRDDLNLPWEKLDKVNEIKKLLKQKKL
ncbi:MAG: methionine adenosyltransferase [Bacilli bacterium]|nr:methionine adenosyltransferase [Bacilli bacterium]